MTWKQLFSGPRTSSNLIMPKVGMKVMTDGSPHGGKKNKIPATIIIVEQSEFCVEYDKPVDGHNASGKGKNGHCWYYSICSYWDNGLVKILRD